MNSSQRTTSIDWPAVVLSMFMLSFIFMIVCGHFEWKQICAGFLLFVDISIALEIQL
jgi:hypothetical protein